MIIPTAYGNLPSFLRFLYLIFDRYLDHVRRFLTGAPNAKRSEITPQLFVGGQYYLHGLDRLSAFGITAIVSLRQSPPRSFGKIAHFRLLRLPTPDHAAPTWNSLQKGIQFIKNEIHRGGKVYIHCHSGEGRGPTMAIAYLMSTGLTFNDAFQFVKRIRPFIHLTHSQVTMLTKLESEGINV